MLRLDRRRRGIVLARRLPFVLGIVLGAGGVAWLLAGADGPQLRADESIVFLPTIGQRTPDGNRWLLDIHGWVFEPGDADKYLAPFKVAMEIEEVDHDEARPEILLERAGWFLVDNERGKHLSVRIGGTVFPMPPSAPDGHFHGRAEVPDAFIQNLRASGRLKDSCVGFEADTPPDRDEVFRGAVLLVDPEGVSVVSDIDDTIRVSHVEDKSEMLKGTFLLPFEAVPGMATVYAEWARRRGIRFHYVSASPWQLYPVLSPFFEAEGFPAGSYHMKDFRWKDSSFFNLFASALEYKIECIEPLLTRFPQRKFILIGDSSEKDPEAYGDLARKYPGQVIGIAIRDVSGDPAEGPRYGEAFRDVPRQRWRIFKNPDDIRTLMPPSP